MHFGVKGLRRTTATQCAINWLTSSREVVVLGMINDINYRDC